MPPAISPPPTVSFSQGTRQLMPRTAASSPNQGAETDEQRWDEQLPEAAQGAPRRQQLDHKERQQRQPGKPRGRGQPAQEPGPEPALVARGQHGTEGQRAEE